MDDSCTDFPNLGSPTLSPDSACIALAGYSKHRSSDLLGSEQGLYEFKIWLTNQGLSQRERRQKKDAARSAGRARSLFRRDGERNRRSGQARVRGRTEGLLQAFRRRDLDGDGSGGKADDSVIRQRPAFWRGIQVADSRTGGRR